MSKSKSEYPIGATWEHIDPVSGARGSVWLAEISYGHEVWRWFFCLSDGSGPKFDYTYNKSSAVRYCAVHFKRKATFKRVQK